MKKKIARLLALVSFCALTKAAYAQNLRIIEQHLHFKAIIEHKPAF